MDSGQTQFALSVSDDRLAVMLDCAVAGVSFESISEKIQAQLKALKISHPFDRESLQKVFTQAQAEGGRISGEVLVRGVAPVPPQDSALHWARDFFGLDFIVDANGKIDYRRRSGQPAVEAGELLAKITPAREGKPGADVFGRRIPVGRPNHLRILLGPNVEEKRDEGVHYYYATAAGRVRWASNVLAVDDVLTISADIGLETGHIKHHGALIINGDVLTGSRIEAQGDIEIHGSIEPSDIQTGGSLTVEQGIAGTKGRRIIVGGGVRAKFLMEVDMEAGGDIIVDSEIIHSNLKSCGRVSMPNGRLIGGVVSAQKGMDIKEAGNALNAPTRLVVGEDFRQMRELEERKQKNVQQKARLEEIRKTLEGFNSKQELTAQDRETMTELQFEEWELANNINAALQEIEAAENEPSHPTSRITIYGTLFAETAICSPNTKVVISEQFPGPMFAMFVNDKLRMQKLEHAAEAIAV